MNWEKLLNSRRLGDERDNYDVFAHRSAFQRDYDRIIFSSAFRRMQDKTQVFPVPENDFVHNRLTHSIEVSSVGRTLGNLVGQYVLELEPQLKDLGNSMHMFGDIVAAASLAHDVGNPPFGHSGETAIGNYFLNNKELKERYKLNDQEWNDLTKYEGNAHGFRLLTNHHPDEIKGGLRLTYATLGCFSKYPRASIVDDKYLIESSIKRTSSKKFSYFQSENDLFKQVAETLELRKLTKEHPEQRAWARHPLVFMVEAADNICYRIIDLEDGYKLGYLKFNEMEELLIPLLKRSFDAKEALKKYQHIKDLGEKIGYLRAKSINVLIYESMEIFKDNYTAIMSGDFDQEITDIIHSADILEGPIKKANIYLYNRKPVIEIELAGYQVISGLLERFMDAQLNPENGMNKKMLQLLPQQFHVNDQDSAYKKIMKAVDFVARMTDSYALNLYRRLSGHSLPVIG
ncbi:MAG: deoxyguanosinetriphosphate triphosphohydrolase [Bacteroidetes bacterium]|nr:MAG: deoxyguanosinetriphosphate triphosphohydrolase [Bacteroidota bacterium]